ncbi:MAG: hypothetical protein IH612_07245 [Desulfofustis sp.]|nr:hypothetical protein [Desulfofustis sp.]
MSAQKLMQLNLFEWGLLAVGSGYAALAELSLPEAERRFLTVLRQLPDHPQANAGLKELRFWKDRYLEALDSPILPTPKPCSLTRTTSAQLPSVTRPWQRSSMNLAPNWRRSTASSAGSFPSSHHCNQPSPEKPAAIYSSGTSNWHGATDIIRR